MKITVIATGFEKTAVATEPVRTYTTAAEGARAPNPGGPTTGGTTGPLRREDVDVPAFIRKKAD
jgi:hypothetical protein